MIEIEFNYNQHYSTIQANLNARFEEVINKYIQKSYLNPSSIYFLANGKRINPKDTVEKQMNDMNKQNKNLKVLVQVIEDGNTKKEVIEKSKDIICPKCLEPCRIKINDFNLELFGCSNNHINDNIKITDFFETQKINISNIICNNCKIKNKGNSPNNEFYTCLNCQTNLCLLCKQNHNSNHNIIRYDQKNYICQEHNENIIKYCIKCNKNICFSCEEDHDKHKTIFLGDLKPNMNEIKNKLLEMKKVIDLFTYKMNNMIKHLNELNDIVKIYYEININIFNSYQRQNRNYQILQNIKEININNKIYEKLNNINKIIDIKDKFINIIDLYNKICEQNSEINLEKPHLLNENKNMKKSNNDNKSSVEKLNQITIIYNINKNEKKIKLFGKNFLIHNKDNCHLLIDGKQNELCEFYQLNNNQKKNNTLKIKLIENKKIIDMSSMFDNCKSIVSLPDISEWNTKNVNNMSRMFAVCQSLKSLPDISDWDLKDVTNLRAMFQCCYSLVSLPDIAKWNTKNVTDMSYMFNHCWELKSLPDISKWNVKNVSNMNYMFKECTSLSSFPDIAKWDINEELQKEDMFKNCNKSIIPENFI